MRVYYVEVAEIGTEATIFDDWNIAARNFESVLCKVNKKILRYKKHKIHLRIRCIREAMHLTN